MGQALAKPDFDRAAYVQAVLGSEPVAPVFDVRKEMRERGDSK